MNRRCPRRMTIVLLLLVSMAAPALPENPPPNAPPNLWRASATERGGKVTIQLARPKYQSPRVAGPAEAMEWDFLRRVSLGNGIDAYDVEGNRLSRTAVLKMLKRPIAVPVFVRLYGPLLEPDPYYLRVFRKDTVVLVVKADAVMPLAP